MSVFRAINPLRGESDGCQDNSLLRAGIYTASATSAIGNFYMGDGACERNGPCRTDILTNLASGTPIGKNSGSRSRFAAPLFISPNSLFQFFDLLFHDSNLLLQRLYSRVSVLPSGSRRAGRIRLLVCPQASVPSATASGTLSSSHSATPCGDRNFHFLALFPFPQ